MCRKNKKIVALFLSCFLISCLGGVSYINLGSHYAWVESREIVKIKEEVENSLYYDVIIRPQVLNFADDEKYIIVYQVYDESEYYDVSAIQSTVERDSLLAQFARMKKIKYCYWIIDKEADKVMGPMRKSEYDRKCKELQVKAEMQNFHEKKFWERRIHGID